MGEEDKEQVVLRDYLEPAERAFIEAAVLFSEHMDTQPGPQSTWNIWDEECDRLEKDRDDKFEAMLAARKADKQRVILPEREAEEAQS